jgi:hypothetical protein
MCSREKLPLISKGFIEGTLTTQKGETELGVQVVVEVERLRKGTGGRREVILLK